MEPPAQYGRFARKSSNGGSGMDIDSVGALARPKQARNSSSGESYIGAEGMSMEEEEEEQEEGEGSGGLTGNSSAEDWFNTLNKDVGANQSFARYEGTCGGRCFIPYRARGSWFVNGVYRCFAVLCVEE